MRIFQRRSVTFISGAVGTAALTLLLMAPRPMVRPAVRPMLPASTSSTITRTSPVGSATLHSTTSLSSSGNSLTATRTTNLNETINGHTASFTATRTLTETPSTANTLTATRTVTLTETINGHTTSVTATNSATATPLTAAQVAGVVLTERLRHREVAALRQAELASASPGYGSSQAAYPSAAPSYAGGGYGGGASAYGGLAYGGGPSQTEAPGTAPGVRPAGYDENRGASPDAESRAARDEKAVNRLLAASGVTDEEGHLLWPVGLRALPGDRVGKLRDQIGAFLAQEREEAVTGVVTGRLYLDLTSSVDALRKRLMLDREERFSLTHQAYEDAEDYLAKLKRAAKSLALIDRLIEGKKIEETPKDRAEYMARLTRVATMLDATPPVEFFETGDTDEDLNAAIVLFQRLNKGGKPLEKGDAEAARLTQRATAKIVPKMREFVLGDEQARLGLNFVFATRALITNHRDTSRFDKLPKNWVTKEGRDINEVWASTERGPSATVSFVRDQLGWTTRRWLPSASALIPLCYLLRDRDGGFLDSELDHVRRYLCLTGLRGLFRGSVETAINSFINPIRKAPGKTQRRASLLVKRIPKDRQQRITAANILTERGMYSPLMQVYMAYLVSKGAKTWLENATLLEVAKRDIGDPIAVHHIFPRSLLRDHDVETERINCMANYAILSQADNAQIGDEHPKIYYDSMEGPEKDNADKQLFGIIAENRDWLESYDAFLAARAERLAKELNRYLGLE